jgi:pyruvate/2-oxoglutarate dehydrogenase complex dihydrolipoamide acyltransferase (E2) component
MVRIAAPVALSRLGWIALGLMVTVSTPSFAQQPPPSGQPATQQPPPSGQPSTSQPPPSGQPSTSQPPSGQPAGQAQAAPAKRVFASDAGMVLNFIKPDQTAAFESVMAKLKEALAKSEKPERKEQAKSWKVFKSPDPAAGGNVLYVFLIDPSVKDADYTVSTILAEAFPAEQVNELYKQYAGAYAQGQNFVNLQLVNDLGK